MREHFSIPHCVNPPISGYARLPGLLPTFLPLAFFRYVSSALIQRCYPDHSNPLSLSTSRDNPAAVVECEPSSSSSSSPPTRGYTNVFPAYDEEEFFRAQLLYPVWPKITRRRRLDSGLRSGGGKSPSLFSNHRRGGHCFLPFLILLLSHNFTSFSQSQLSSNGQMNSPALQVMPSLPPHSQSSFFPAAR